MGSELHILAYLSCLYNLNCDNICKTYAELKFFLVAWQFQNFGYGLTATFLHDSFNLLISYGFTESAVNLF